MFTICYIFAHAETDNYFISTIKASKRRIFSKAQYEEENITC